MDNIMIKKIIKKLISSTGYDVYKKGFEPISQESMTAGLRRLNQIRISPDIIVDLGGCAGNLDRKSIAYMAQCKI